MDIQQSDLMTVCPTCKGEGYTIKSSGGSSSGVSSRMSENCPDCRGRGFTITDSGQAILDFLREAKAKGLFN